MAHVLSAAIVKRIAAIEAEDDFLNPPARVLALDGASMGLLLSLAHEAAARRVADGDDAGDMAVHLVASAVMAVDVD